MVECFVFLRPLGLRLASLKRIRQIADIVIPGHDPDVVPGSAGLRLPPSARVPHVENTSG
ncbi:hypothetical protein QYH69_24955 [Paraburkholderia sp. SARCC-3016]|uniref:hypothetical protein n=1 Tax=Paraburkholderia sp. SARCC-3016 TaxID=3058611 RepID=UPI0028099FC9|nr:hypothetical protein [Paraburkholderia sp. SARCC-3016]MDQ7980490.1 hypothetical protein [Paraburkholderia sp. SARCC-3016]